MSYFPMFIDLKDKKCLIVGGSNIALQKVNVLLDFTNDITIIAPSIMNEIKNKDVCCIEKTFEVNDLDLMDIVVATTNDKELNHNISILCKERNIMVNVVDQKEDCTFIFPSYIKQQDLIAAFSSSGNSPVLTQYLKEENKKIVTKELGDFNHFLGNNRTLIKQEISYDKRKKFYQELLNKVLDDSFDEEVFYQMLNTYKEEQ